MTNANQVGFQTCNTWNPAIWIRLRIAKRWRIEWGLIIAQVRSTDDIFDNLVWYLIEFSKLKENNKQA